MTPQFELALAFGAGGAAFMLLSNLMKRMTPLRLFALAANAFFIVQFAIERNWLLIALQASLLSINVYRLWSLRRLLVTLEQANAHTSVKDWLLPQMKKKKFRAGTTLFEAGDHASELFYIASGTLRSPELQQTLGPGHLIGEVGMFSEDHRRAASVVCETDCVCYSMTDEAAYLLYIQNPQLGFYLIRLIIDQLRGELARRPLPPARSPGSGDLTRTMAQT